MTIFTGLAVAGFAMGTAGLLVGVLAYVRGTRLARECAARAREPAFNSGGSIDPRAIRNVAMLRYDAFRDMGGRMSFSVALLDSTGDGVVLTSINAHSEARTYAKVIHAGGSTHDLSPEEEQVLAQARDGRHVRSPNGQAVDARDSGVEEVRT